MSHQFKTVNQNWTFGESPCRHINCGAGMCLRGMHPRRARQGGKQPWALLTLSPDAKALNAFPVLCVEKGPFALLPLMQHSKVRAAPVNSGYGGPTSPGG